MIEGRGFVSLPAGQHRGASSPVQNRFLSARHLARASVTWLAAGDIDGPLDASAAA